MSNVEFVLPINKDDLCSESPNQYVVNEVIPARDIKTTVVGLHNVFLEEGLDFIANNFDTFYSILRHFEKLDDEIKLDSWQVLMSVAKKLSSQLSFVLQNEDEHVEYELRNKYRNLLKMTVYLMSQLSDAFETALLKPSVETVVACGKSNKKRPKKIDDLSWENEREGFVNVLHQLYNQPIHKLWDPPVIEEEFLSLGTGCCFKMLENSAAAKNKILRELIFDFLGICLKKHNNTVGFSVKIIQLLQDHEHLVTPLANAVSILVKEYGAKNLICEIIREVGYIDVKDLSKDATGMRSISLFIVELAGLCTADVLKAVSLLLPYLDEDAHLMRNCVLSVLGEIVMKVLSGDALDEKSREIRDQILDKLEQHLHDVSSFVRSKCLQVWKQICSEQAVPLPRLHQLLELVIGRLSDKTAGVRKHAVQFLTMFLQKNPYTAVLSEEEIKKNAEKEKEKLKNMLAEGDKEARGEKENNDVEMDDESPLDPHAEDEVRRAINFSEVESEPGSEADKEIDGHAPCGRNNDNELVSTLNKQKVLVKYLEDTARFAEQITKALSLICEFMLSRTVSDVLEAIDFFVTAFEFGVSGAVAGVKKMLNLVWSKENAVKEAVVDAYRHLYFKTEGVNARSEGNLVSRNLIGFLKNATISEIACIEELVKEFFKTGDINNHVITVLWERFSKKLPDTTDEESYSSLVLLSMAAGHKPEIVSSNIDNLVSIGLGERGKADFRLAKETCIALLKMRTIKPNVESKDPPFRLKETHNVFARLTELLVEGIANVQDSNWIPYAEQAISVIYCLADFPEKLCSNIIKKLAQAVIDNSKNPDETSQQSDNSNVKYSSRLLCRFIAVCGHIALVEVIHLETNVFAELKRRENLKEKHRKQKSRFSVNKSIITPTTTPSITPLSKSNEAEEDTGLIGAVADDAEGEFIRKIAETELLNGRNILGLLCPFIMSVSKDQSKYSSPELCAASSLALAKFMMVNSNFCEQNMQLLITIMEKSSEPITRANIIVALGDLATRFPNVVEPWTSHIYGRLKDPSVHVRKYTLNVLTHLILHDMIKVKGSISGVALCVTDENEQIVGMTKFFFEELSRKSGGVYNVLPDIISNLSEPKNGPNEEVFQTIMKFVFQFIEKDKQIEGLVEKLCSRIRSARNDEQCYKIAFCLSLLKFNEKCLNKLQENLHQFGDKIKDPIIQNYLSTIVNTAKKSGNPKMEADIQALMKQLDIS